MGRTAATVLLLMMVVGAAMAAKPSLELGKPEVHGDRILVDVKLHSFFPDDSLASLEAGVPATLVFRWQVRREREGWRDVEVAEGQIKHRIYYDVLEETYHLFDQRGRPLGACDALLGLKETLCNREGLVLEGIPELKPGHDHYLEMEVSLATLGHEEVQGFESWLRGDEDGGNEDPDSGLSGVTLGVIKRMAGMEDSRVRAVSPVFRDGS